MKYKKEYEDYSRTRRNDETSLNNYDCYNINGLVVGTKSKTILDYGSGHGNQYHISKMHKKFHIEYHDITLYDPAIPAYSERPTNKFDGVISTDVLEHIPMEELPDTLEYIFSVAEKFVYLGVFCGASVNKLSNGDNAHCTILYPYQWRDMITSYNVNDIPQIITYRIPVNAEEDVLGIRNLHP